MLVTLKWFEIAMAAEVGVRRKVESMRKSLKPLHEFAGHHSFDIDIMGACGELAVAKLMRLYWDGSVGTFKANDLQGWQVRTRISTHYEGLVLRDNDRDEDNTILVVASLPSFDVLGYVNNARGKRMGVRKVLQKGRPPAIVVAESLLEPLNAVAFNDTL